jgi:hypothetical protein
MMILTIKNLFELPWTSLRNLLTRFSNCASFEEPGKMHEVFEFACYSKAPVSWSKGFADCKDLRNVIRKRQRTADAAIHLDLNFFNYTIKYVLLWLLTKKVSLCIVICIK